MAKTRLHYFDVLKGLAIFMVVIGHVLTMCIRDIDSAVLFKLVEKIHMPIFFFISGYFTYKVTEKGNIIVSGIFSRVKQLIVPFLAVSALWLFYFPHSGLQSPFDSTLEGLYFSVGKNGYWFTLCLFEIIILYYAITPLLNLSRNVLFRLLVILLTWIGLGCIASVDALNKFNALTSLALVYEFFPVFMLGVISRSHNDIYEQITEKGKYITIAMIAGSFLMYYVCWPWEFQLPMMFLPFVKLLLYVCVVIMAVAIVKPWCNRSVTETLPDGTRMVRLWKYLGTQSLSIYLLHYFFLIPIPVLREPLIGMNLNFVPTLIVAGILATVIIAVTLGANYIICRSRILALCLTGKIK